MKYRILVDFYSEGFKFWDDDGYDTIDEAVKEAQTHTHGNPFLIIQVIDWMAVESLTPTKGEK